MRTEIIVALITALPTILMALVTIWNSNRLIGFKIDELEKKFDALQTKVEKHNNLVERIAVLERDEKTAFNNISELRKDLNTIEGRVWEK